MSGCFDGAVGDAEGTEDATDGATVINNYHNNTTEVNLVEHHYYNNTTTDVGPEYFVVGGMVDNNTTNEPRVANAGTYYYPYNFSTTSGQTVFVHQLTESYADSITLESDCGEGGEWSVSETQTTYSEHHNGYWVAGSAFDCQHSIKMLGGFSGIGFTTYPPPYYFSLIYSIEDMTVIPV